MALARALTTIARRNKHNDEASSPTFVGRAASQRGGRPVLRAQISSPLALVSTSNMNIHDAQDIAGTAPIDILQAIPSSSASDTSISGDESDTGSSTHSATITDASSIEEESPLRSEPEPNHLSCYFKPAVDTTVKSSSRISTTSSSGASSLLDSTEVTPRIPQRVPSHSKRAHERLHRTRSLQRMMSPGPSTRSALSNAMRSSVEALGLAVEAPVRDSSPFSRELAQLDEVAEEFGQVVASHCAELDAEARFLAEAGLACFAAEDYAYEIQALVVETFGEMDSSATWI